MSCCPPGSERYLAPDYNTSGDKVRDGAGCELYRSGAAGPAGRGLLIVPDIFGWAGGRTRNIADWFAACGYLVVVPKLLQPSQNGGTDDDGCEPELNMATLLPYIKSITWDEVIKPRVASAIEYMVAQGAHRIAVVGFCWGGWVAAKMAGCELAEHITCIASPHPSISAAEERFIDGGNTMNTISLIQRPTYFGPAQNDPDGYREGGEWFEHLKAKFPSSRTSNFSDVSHGFFPRGDIKDPAVLASVERCFAELKAFFDAHA